MPLQSRTDLYVPPDRSNDKWVGRAQRRSFTPKPAPLPITPPLSPPKDFSCDRKIADQAKWHGCAVC